ncbi:tail fiber protein [Nitratireductor soli]|uniref:tail fiber protein n=1 Tax=Nitratireductor soli TaxID=1670619 RepID=UPI000AA230C0|nr:tail fiber protein [Nitratireductor soli]
MADPTKYTVSYDFSGYQATNPSAPLPGASVDNEYANIATSIGEAVDAIKDIRRADGSLQNGIVGPDSLGAGLTVGFKPRGQWAEDVDYNAGDSVVHEGYFFAARVQHTSATTTEPVGGNDTATWLSLFAISTAVGNMLQSDYDPNGRVADVFDVDNHVSGTTNKVYTGAEQTKLAGVEAGATASPYLPAGLGPLPYSGASAPTGWLLCYGQAVSRTTYADLFTAIGTVYGTGDGSTTFNLPDMRGRVPAGQDDMGGSSANRLTDQTNGVDGDVLGAAGGAETQALSVAQLPVHNHGGASGADGAHAHTLSFIGLSGETELPLSSGGESFGSTIRTGGTPRSGTLSVDATSTHTHSIASQGSGQAHNNVQPTLIVNYIIKT